VVHLVVVVRLVAVVHLTFETETMIQFVVVSDQIVVIEKVEE
jgi:hypothetical protein